MKITFLGTSSMMPTKERNAFSVLISHEKENILIDCGEGTQRQLRMINFSPAKITKILITHWHGDHVLGLPGLIQTLAASNYQRTLEIYGPKGTKKLFKKIMGLFVNEGRINIRIIEITKDGRFYGDSELILESASLDHTTLCRAYSIKESDKRKMNMEYLKKIGLVKHPLLGDLQRGRDIEFKGKNISPEKATYIKKGKKVAIITDTKLCGSCYSLAKDADLLICEATFMSNLKDKAAEYMHLTSDQAALIAKKSKSKRLILTHISQRYKVENNKKIELEARRIFKDTTISKDLLTLEV